MCVVHVRVYVLICVLNYNPPPSPIKLKLLSSPPKQRVLFAALRIIVQCASVCCRGWVTRGVAVCSVVFQPRLLWFVAILDHAANSITMDEYDIYRICNSTCSERKLDTLACHHIPSWWQQWKEEVWWHATMCSFMVTTVSSFMFSFLKLCLV